MKLLADLRILDRWRALRYLDGQTQVELRLSHMSCAQEEMRRSLTAMRQLQKTRHCLREADGLGQRYVGTHNADKPTRQDARAGLADLEWLPAVRERP